METSATPTMDGYVIGKRRDEGKIEAEYADSIFPEYLGHAVNAGSYEAQYQQSEVGS